jgi:hypothetical protein
VNLLSRPSPRWWSRSHLERTYVYVATQALAPTPQPRHHRADRNPEGAHGFFVAKFLGSDQQEHLTLVLRQYREAPQQITTGERGFLRTPEARQVRLRDLVQGASPEFSSAPRLFGDEAIIEDRKQPTAQVAARLAFVAMRNRSFEAILHEVVGAFLIAAEQRSRKAT